MMIAFYYGITGLACPIYFRREFRSLRSILLAGVAPSIGGIVLFWALYKSVSDGINPNPEDADGIWLGHFSPPVIIGVRLLPARLRADVRDATPRQDVLPAQARGRAAPASSTPSRRAGRRLRADALDRHKRERIRRA